MGNENKVTDIIQRSKEVFLPDELRPDETTQVYSLADEFAKTRKNRSFAFFFIVLGFVTSIVVASVLVTQYIQHKQRLIDIGISDFEDLKLRELLESSNKFQGELNSARDALEDIKLQMQKEILSVKDASSRDRDAILSKNLSNDETDRQLKRIQAREEQRINQIKAQYQRKIDEKEIEITGLKAKVDSYDQNMKAGVQKAENILNNFQKLHNIRMEKQKAFYEGEIENLKNYYKRYIDSLILKYNPVFSAQLNPILKAPMRKEYESTPPLKDYQAELRREGVMAKDKFSALRKSIDENSILISRMQRIPYENSVPDALNQMAQLTNRIIYDYENLWYDLIEVIRQKNSIISNYKYAFDFHSKQFPETGFVIDPRDPNSIRIHLSTIQSINNGDIGLIFRNEDEYIGKIQFVKKPFMIVGKTIEVAQFKRIQPFDKILLKIQKENKE